MSVSQNPNPGAGSKPTNAELRNQKYTNNSVTDEDRLSGSKVFESKKKWSVKEVMPDYVPDSVLLELSLANAINRYLKKDK